MITLQCPQPIAIGSTLSFATGTATLQAPSGTQVVLDGGGSTQILNITGRHAHAGRPHLPAWWRYLQQWRPAGRQPGRRRISNNGGTLTVTNSTFSENSAPDPGGDGGAIYNAGTLLLTNSTFSGNSAGSGGGAILNSDSMTVSTSTFTDNSAALQGGAIYNNSDTLTVTDSTFISNSATTLQGGAIFSSGALRRPTALSPPTAHHTEVPSSTSAVR